MRDIRSIKRHKRRQKYYSNFVTLRLIFDPRKLVHTATATATEIQYFFLSWMGCVESNETVHMVTDGNSNGNSITAKWVVDPFCDDNVNRKKYTYMQLYCCQCHCHQSPCEQSYLIPHKPFMTAMIPLPVKIYFIWTDHQRNPLSSQCERAFTTTGRVYSHRVSAAV